MTLKRDTIKNTILENRKIAPGIYEMALRTPKITSFKPGQFVMVYLDKAGLLLPRPISICRRDGDYTILVYKVVGQGTEYMASLQPGESLSLMGPLGNGFKVNKGLKKVALLGAGIGIPPLVALFRHLYEKTDIKTDIFLGFKQGMFLVNQFDAASLLLMTHGNLIELLKQAGQNYDEIYACGPKTMLADLSLHAKEKGIPLQISLEERMACGIGACMGCAVPKEEDGYARVCCEGPVFYSDKVEL